MVDHVTTDQSDCRVGLPGLREGSGEEGVERVLLEVTLGGGEGEEGEEDAGQEGVVPRGVGASR